MVKIPFKEGVAEAERVGIKSSEEKWNEYRLEDGTKLRVKVVVASVYKLKNEYNPNTGEPIYVIKSDNIIDAEIPEELYKSK